MLRSDLRVAILGGDDPEATRMRMLLEPAWSCYRVAEWGRIDQGVVEATVAVLVAGDLSDSRCLSTLGLLHTWTPHLPIVLCTLPNPDNLRRVVGLNVQELYFLAAERRELDEVVWAAACEDGFVRLSESLCRFAELPRLCRRGLQHACLSHPPDLVEAVERASTGQTVYIRTVRQLAKILGCSPAYLSRCGASAGLGVGDFLRWITFLRGITLHTPGRSWGEIALRLGFGGHPAWSNFVRRLTGVTPTEVEARSVGDWWTAFNATLPQRALRS